MATLHNKVDKRILKEKIKKDNTPRITISFYKYVIISDPKLLRDSFFTEWEKLNVLGRIYVAAEGINAQLSVPESNMGLFRNSVDSNALFTNVPFKFALEDNGKSFYKLAIKVRPKIVADGLNDSSFDVTNVGKHLTAKEWNEAMEGPNVVMVDMRNHYESEVGHFIGAICPDSDTFKEELPLVLDLIKDEKDKKVLLYCTGGVRCEKASAFLKHNGFKDVNQLHGGIIDYVRQLKEEGLESKFIGKNFVFDERLGERITPDIIAKCHQCGTVCDTHSNCANEDCNLLFIQCPECYSAHNGCCSKPCIDIVNMPMESQKILRKGKFKPDTRKVFKKGRHSISLR